MTRAAILRRAKVSIPPMWQEEVFQVDSPHLQWRLKDYEGLAGDSAWLQTLLRVADLPAQKDSQHMRTFWGPWAIQGELISVPAYSSWVSLCCSRCLQMDPTSHWIWSGHAPSRVLPMWCDSALSSASTPSPAPPFIYVVWALYHSYSAYLIYHWAFII